ncbi:MAG: hypothetical protein AVO35_04115 [Candidatus Aegiribacteria sp. MLS_C]|nr:MAG: hypothetical protein AVO35_04115 [Candidatus Aegiribacteria sp. MLS_C]
MTLLLAVLIAIPPDPSGICSRISTYRVIHGMEGDTLVRTVDLRGVQGSDRLLSRVVIPFDPEYQSILLCDAEMGPAGADPRDIPSWAVDTLTGSGGRGRSLVAAFPALAEGMEVHVGLVLRDWSDSWSHGAWGVLQPVFNGMKADSCIFCFEQGMIEGIAWSGDDYLEERRNGMLVLSGGASAGPLTFSPFQDHRELYEFILQKADNALSGPFPPDLREAALQATSAGADHWSQSMRARTLLCNSIAPAAGSEGGSSRECSSLQEILDSRTATPLEMAVVFTAVCRELGMNAEIVPAGGSAEGIPVPSGWDRFLVGLRSDGGGEWLVEPSAYLTPASWITRNGPLNCIRAGRLFTLPSNNAGESCCIESWKLDTSEGTFVLSLRATGWFDVLLRRMTAGLPVEQLILEFSELCWLAGRTTVPETLELSDPYVLDSRMTITVAGRLGGGGLEAGTIAVLPALAWSVPDSLYSSLDRSWTIEGTCVPVALEEGMAMTMGEGCIEVRNTSSAGIAAVVMGTLE